MVDRASRTAHDARMNEPDDVAAAPPALSLADHVAVLAGHVPGDLFEAERAAVGAGAGEALAAALPDCDDRGRGRLLRVIARVGAPAGLVAPLLGAESGAIRVDAARALGACGSGAVAPLLAALGEAAGALRVEIVRALGRIGDRKAVSAVGAEAAGGEARAVAIDALGAIGGGAAQARLIELLDADDPAARAGAARALGRTGPDPLACAALLRRFATAGEPHDVRRNAVHALAEVGVPLPEGDPAGPAALVAALDGPFGREAKKALARLTDGEQ